VLDKPYSDIVYIRLSTASGSMITFSIVAFGKMISRSPSKSPFTALFSWGATSFEEDALEATPLQTVSSKPISLKTHINSVIFKYHQ